MIPGRHKALKPEDFREGLTCEVVGCVRIARHQWAYPCAINTLIKPNGKGTWVILCDECDLVMNDVLLRTLGIPPHVMEDVMHRYKMVQGDSAYG